MAAEGGDATQVTRGGGRAPAESPDGKTLYYAHLLPEKGIWKMPVQGGEAVQVTGPVTEVPEFVVTAEGIYYATAPESPKQHLIQFLSFSTRKTRTVVVTDRKIGRGLGLSPDQRFLVFTQHDRTGSDLMVIENFSVR
jgi:hypothetical protein